MTAAAFVIGSITAAVVAPAPAHRHRGGSASPPLGEAVATPAALATLGAYAAIAGAVIAIVMSRRDVTG